MRFKKYRDLGFGAAALLFSGFYLINAAQIKTRPKLTPGYASARIMPILLGVLLAILSVLCIIQSLRKMKTAAAEEPQSKTSKGDLMAVLLTFIVIIGYVIIMPILGFILSTVIYLFLQMLILAPAEKRNYALFAIVAVVFTALVFVAFRIGLQQLLPRGVIEGLLGF
ncbi:MAG: tripartite tricarboxylate transporter TctB family protein [Clostridia bacterium]|nr:tripartite tricarboxylate transporter TctB family protein [Clostridia bacterium]